MSDDGHEEELLVEDDEPELDPEEVELQVKEALMNLIIRTGITTVAYPISVLKVLFELGFEPYPLSQGKQFIVVGRNALFLPNVVVYARYLIRDYGFRVLYTGYESAVFSSVISRATIRYSASYIDKYFPNFGGKPTPPVAEELLSDHESFRRVIRTAIRGTFTNCVGIIVCRPFTVIMIRKIAQLIAAETKYTHLVQTVLRIGHEEGPAGYFSGLLPALLMEATYVWGAHLIVYAFDRCIIYGEKKTILGDDNAAHQAAKAARRMAKFLTPYTMGLIVHPLSVVSTVMATIGSGLAVSMLPYSPPFDHWQDAYSYLKPNGLKRGSSLFLREQRGAVSVGAHNQLYASSRHFY